jgi:Na+/proline symporter
MAAVSSDFNAIASVLTQDVYHCLINTSASPRRLFQVGRAFTVLLGALTTTLALWIAYSHREALFNLMVTVFGIFLAPTLLPVLPALVSRRVTTVGALTGFSLGLASGLTMLLLKTYWQGAVQVAGSIYEFEGIALLSNIAMTLLGLWFGSVIGRRSVDEKARQRIWHKDADSGPRF